MRIELVPVRGLKSTVSINDGLNVDLLQFGVASASCWFNGAAPRGRIYKVTADDGIDFMHASGMRLSLAAGADITELCDIEAMAKDIAWLVEERAELAPAPRRAQYLELAAV